MSIFSPCNSFTTAWTREPRMPTQAPTGSTDESRDMDRDFGARARIAGDRFDLDNAVVDFRHFLGEQLRHELRVGARQENLRTALFAAHVVNIGADAVAVAENFARQHLVAPHDRFAAAEIDHDVAVFDALDDAVDDVADAVLVFLVLPVAFGFAHFLHDHLLGRLRSDAAVFERRQRIGDGVAQLRGGMTPARVLEADLKRGIFYRVHHEHVPRQMQFAAFRIDLGANFGFAAVA